MGIESTFSALEVGKKGLLAHRTALDTVGHNITNAAREGYSRQRVNLKAADSYTDPSLARAFGKGQIGQGVVVESVERIRDELLDTRIIGQADKVGYWQARSKYISQLEDINQEPLGSSIRKSIDSFWQGWQDLSNNVGDLNARFAVAEKGQALADSINHKFRGLQQIHDSVNDEIKITAEQINSYTQNISSLNTRIAKSQAMGDNPNDLMDERDIIVDKLSQLANITVENRRDPNEFQVHVDGVHLVQGRISYPLKVEAQSNSEKNNWQILWQKDNSSAIIKGGKLGSLIELRDKDIRNEIQQLNSLAISLTDMVNQIHREGYGMDKVKGRDFFQREDILSSATGSYDRSGNGEFDSTMLYRITGTHSLKPNEQIGFNGVITLQNSTGESIDIPYRDTDTVDSVIDRVNNSSAEVIMRLDRLGRLEVRGTTSENLNHYDFVIGYLEDSGEFLTRYSGVLKATGALGAYDWENPNAVESLVPEQTNENKISYNIAVAPLAEPAGWLSVSKDILQDKSRVAGGFGILGNPAELGDNSTALAIASLNNSDVMIGKHFKIIDYFTETLADLGVKGQVAETTLEAHSAIMKDLNNIRSAISGVNMDEELSYMLQFQQGFMASSRYITTINTLLDTIIHLGG